MALYFPLCLINYTGSSPWLCPPLLFPKGSVELVSRVTSHVGKIAYLTQSKIEFSLHMNFARYLVVLTDLSLFFYFRYSNKLVAAVFITLAIFAIVGLATMKNEYRECTGIIIRRVLFLRYPFPCCRRLWFIPLTQHSGSSCFGSSFSFENCNI